jgi:hypothetical protein
MLIGNFAKTDKQITDALCSGALSRSEALFIQRISERIGRYRERAFVSPKEADFLDTILMRFEQNGPRQRKHADAKRAPRVAPTLFLKPPRHAPDALPTSLREQAEPPTVTQTEPSTAPPWCSTVEPDSPQMSHPSSPASPQTVHPSSPPAVKPSARQPRELGSMICEVIQRNEAMRARKKVMEERFLRSLKKRSNSTYTSPLSSRSG